LTTDGAIRALSDAGTRIRLLAPVALGRAECATKRPSPHSARGHEVGVRDFIRRVVDASCNDGARRAARRPGGVSWDRPGRR
jgi:hypothetical protein